MGKRGPKPKGQFSSKGATLSARITIGTRERLEKAAHDAGHSISEEVELRLKASFEDEDLYGGPGTSWVLSSIGTNIPLIERRAQRRWLEDPYTFDQCVEFIQCWLARLRPLGNGRRPRTLAQNLDPPAEFATKNAFQSVITSLAAMDAGLDISNFPGGDFVKRFASRFNLSEDEQKFRASLQGLIATGAITFDFPRRGK